jgi:hypothetical protein
MKVRSGNGLLFINPKHPPGHQRTMLIFPLQCIAVFGSPQREWIFSIEVENVAIDHPKVAEFSGLIKPDTTMGGKIATGEVFNGDK